MRSPYIINLCSTTLSLAPNRCGNNRQPTSQNTNSSTLASNSNQLEKKLNKFNKPNTDSQLKQVNWIEHTLETTLIQNAHVRRW